MSNAHNRSIRVPLAVEAQTNINLGPMLFPLRAIALGGLVGAPLAIAIITVPLGQPMLRFFAALFVLLTIASLGVPTKEGIWVGTYTIYKWSYKVMPSLVIRGQVRRAVVRHNKGTVQISGARPTYRTKVNYLKGLNTYADLPKVSTVAPGIIELTPGGARAILMFEGPTVSLSSDSYLAWCQQVMNWISSLDCPAQFITVMTHFDSERAQQAFDQRTEGWPRVPLYDMERQLAGDVAQQTLGLKHFLVLSPLLAPLNGLPPQSYLKTATRTVDTPVREADRVLNSAKRMAKSFGIEVREPDRDDLTELLSHTVLGPVDSMVGDGVLRIGDQHHVVLTMTKLPPTLEVGLVVDAMMRTHARGITSLHVIPVDMLVAQKMLHKRSTMIKYLANRGGEDAIEHQVALQDTANVVAAMAQRDIKPVRVALTMSVCHAEHEKAIDAAERLGGVLAGAGCHMERVTSPGFLPALAMCPGAAPLGRSLLVTSDSAALRMLPALGTPFNDIRAPLLGISALNGAPAYFSIWTPPNHNLVVVGSSGAGKSVSAKTMLIRHIMEGVGAVVIDPDSEYRSVMTAVGGEYFELGEDAINPFAGGVDVAPDLAATRILPILSVMGGDEKGVKDGHAIRRLPDEDQGWLHAELAHFYQQWAATHSQDGIEPVMHDVIDFIETESASRALTQREADRCRIITARLRRYTQGDRARVFDRPSTFKVTNRPVAIGLKVFAMTYGADLTPALAVVLTSILAAVERKQGRMIVVVDEAHRVTSDPDAGEVLGQLVRQARKYGAGVWMMSQRVEDFVRTDLGRTLAATASTKLILGTEEAVVEEVADVFKLRDEEKAAINPMQQGRGVLLCGPDRTIVHVVPGAMIMALSDTSGSISAAAHLRNPVGQR